MNILAAILVTSAVVVAQSSNDEISVYPNTTTFDQPSVAVTENPVRPDPGLPRGSRGARAAAWSYLLGLLAGRRPRRYSGPQWGGHYDPIWSPFYGRRRGPHGWRWGKHNGRWKGHHRGPIWGRHRQWGLNWALYNSLLAYNRENADYNNWARTNSEIAYNINKIFEENAEAMNEDD